MIDTPNIDAIATDMERVEELVAKKKNGTITPKENLEFDIVSLAIVTAQGAAEDTNGVTKLAEVYLPAASVLETFDAIMPFLAEDAEALADADGDPEKIKAYIDSMSPQRSLISKLAGLFIMAVTKANVPAYYVGHGFSKEEGHAEREYHGKSKRDDVDIETAFRQIFAHIGEA